MPKKILLLQAQIHLRIWENMGLLFSVFQIGLVIA